MNNGDLLGPYNERRNPEWTSLLYSYLARRMFQGPDHACPKSRIRLVAERICELSGDVDHATLETCIQNLCPLVFFRMRNSNIVPWIQSMPERELSDGSFERYLIDATVYLGLTDLTSTLLEAQDFSCKLLHRRLEMAAYKGNLKMIEILLAAKPAITKDDGISPHLGSILLEAASEGKHTDIFNYVLDNREPSGYSDWDNDRHRQALAQVAFPGDYERGIASFGYGFDTPKRSKVEGEGDLDYKLCDSNSQGHIQMVQYFLGRGACLNHPSSKRGVATLNRIGGPMEHTPMPLNSAIHNIGNEPIVKLMLEHGADPNWFLPELNSLKLAVQKNSLSIAQMLTNHGADIDDGNPPPILIAVEKENMEMFRFLRQNDATLNTPKTGPRAMRLAKSNGLMSMITVLIEEGVEEFPVLSELEPERFFNLDNETLGWYMTSKEGKETSRYSEYRAQWSITKAFENGNGFKIPRT